MLSRMRATQPRGIPVPPRVQPKINALNELLRHEQVVVAKKNDARSHFRAAHELDPLPDHALSRDVLWVSLTREDELDGAFPVSKDAHKPLRIVQQKVWALVRRKAPRKP